MALVVPTAVSGSQPYERTGFAVFNDPPVITSFKARPGLGNLWTFSGTVTDENPAGCTIAFGGVLSGITTTVAADGTFTYTTELPPGMSGGVSAQAFDEAGLESNIAESYVG
jgi:hypothetical protein